MADDRDVLVTAALRSTAGLTVLVESLRKAVMDRVVHKDDAVEEEDFDRAWELRRRAVVEQIQGMALAGDANFASVERLKNDLIEEYRALLGF